MMPSKTMTIEMTHARTGRSMKKRASMAGLRLGFFRLRGISIRRCGRNRHIHQVRLDRDTGPHQLYPVDDDLLARLQAVLDSPQAIVDWAQPDRSGDDLVILIHDIDNFLSLI